MKQLRKSENKIITGVCGGIAEYFNIDATIIRLIVCIITVVELPVGLISYIAAAILMPSSEGDSFFSENKNKFSGEKSKTEDAEDAEFHTSEDSSTSKKSSAPHSDDEFNQFFNKKK